MPANAILDYCVPQQAWEGRGHRDAAGNLIIWHVTAVRDGGAEPHALYQAASSGVIYQAEVGDDDADVAIDTLGVTKRYDLGVVARVHSVYLRLEAAADDLTILARVGGSEYGVRERSYTVSLAGTADEERRIRIHRDMVGRWLQLELSGSMSARPAVRELTARVIAIRSGRLTL